MNYYSNGKLLITGEYVVLDGALSLAVPTTYGQSLSIESFDGQKLIWKSLDDNRNVWFEGELSFEQIASTFVFDCAQTDKFDADVSNRLIQILKAAKQLNPQFLNSGNGFKVTTKLDFPRNWGLGTSSTLINNIANWANVDAYKLLELTFGGSGYDIACAKNDSAITYQLELNNEIYNSTGNGEKRLITPVDFNPVFKDHLYFVHLNKKQNSREGIAQYKLNTSNLAGSISEINTITSAMISCKYLPDFNRLIETHESIIGSIIKQQPIKKLLFSDFDGAIKSLGAWGGDFVLVSALTNPKAYFEGNGYNTIIPYKEMVL